MTRVLGWLLPLLAVALLVLNSRHLQGDARNSSLTTLALVATLLAFFMGALAGLRARADGSPRGSIAVSGSPPAIDPSAHGRHVAPRGGEPP